jgi:hypothetical protein
VDQNGETTADVTGRLLRLFTNGVVDTRLEKAASILQGDCSVNEKLERINALIPFPPTASAEDLGRMLGVTKQAIHKTAWWTENRRRAKDEETDRRLEMHRSRAKQAEHGRPIDDDA